MPLLNSNQPLGPRLQSLRAIQSPGGLMPPIVVDGCAVLGWTMSLLVMWMMTMLRFRQTVSLALTTPCMPTRKTRHRLSGQCHPRHVLPWNANTVDTTNNTHMNQNCSCLPPRSLPHGHLLRKSNPEKYSSNGAQLCYSWATGRVAFCFCSKRSGSNFLPRRRCRRLTISPDR